MKKLLIVAVVVLLLIVGGWLTVRSDNDGVTIGVDAEKAEQDVSTAADSVKRAASDAADKIDDTVDVDVEVD